MLSTLNVRAESHNSCEDSLWVQEKDGFIDGIISDGCSTGIKSHFASQAICYAFKEAMMGLDTMTDGFVIKTALASLRGVAGILGLTEMHLLGTVMAFNYEKLTKTLTIRVFGDGVYYINDIEYIIDQNNTPDYLGYHLKDNAMQFNDFLDKYPYKVFYNVNRFMICSDGIKSIVRSSLHPATTLDPNVLLFHPPESENYLTRMWNKLKMNKFTLGDDLSIISYVS